MKNSINDIIKTYCDLLLSYSVSDYFIELNQRCDNLEMLSRKNRDWSVFDKLQFKKDEIGEMISSEFGRTPKINKDAGRDHWPRVFSVVFAGGGFKRGYVYGSSDATGSDVDTNPLTVENLAATMYNQLGIDPETKLMAAGGRPSAIVKDGAVVKDLLV